MALNKPIARTSEIDRIKALPRRPAGFDPTARLTALLKAPNGEQSLRQTQALSLFDAGTCKGLFCSAGVGEGKTLITLLAPYVLNAKRPVLVLPAGLLRKTRNEEPQYRLNWRVPTNIRHASYELLGRVSAATWLHDYQPDLLLFDEVHKLKNKRAAVTRRVSRYLKDFPETQVIALSGTIMRKSLLDFGHIVRWCLKEGSPIPLTDAELEEWAEVIDEDTDEFFRPEPGPLLELAQGDDIAQIRDGFRRRFTETPGIVATVGEGERVDCSIYLSAIHYDPNVDAEFQKLRSQWQTPDGWELTQAVDVWRHANELALGLFYRWDPRPPREWLDARKEWAAFVRETLAYSRTLDSELQVVHACDAGKLDDKALKAWREVRDSFKPNTVAVWCDDTALNRCIDWAKTPGLIWTEHDLFARRLAQVTGLPYYGAKGLTDAGDFIDNADPTRAAIASLDANREGRNLQKIWNRCLFTTVPPWDAMHQAIGRFHRPGQDADEVIVDILLGCLEHARGFRRALADARAVRDTTGTVSKLLLADIDWPSDDEIDLYEGPRWGKENEQ